MRAFFQNILRWWKREKPIEKEFNYLYFSLLFFSLSSMILSHFLNLEHPFLGFPLVFALYGVGQTLLEILFFILISYILMRWAPKWIFFGFIIFSFIIHLIHYTDFILLRVLDVSFTFIFTFFLSKGIDNILATFQALRLNSTMVIASLSIIFSIPLTGLFIYWATSKLTRKKPLHLSLPKILIGIGSIATLLLLIDLMAYPHWDRLFYRNHQKRLPFGSTFFSPSPNRIQLSQKPSLSRKEPESLPSLTAHSLPNIYFFVIETLRRDFITEEIAPHLTQFEKENIQFIDSYSNANCTQLSWFSLFHSDFPFYWTQMKEEWQYGSLPLRLLKNLGYKIHVYTSANLDYFGMDPLLFGRKTRLPDKLKDFFPLESLESCAKDALVIQNFKEDIENYPEGNLFIFFLDSTHSEYSFPADFPLKFEPIAREIEYLTITRGSKELEGIKNRYRNSIHYIDHLMGNFFEIVKKKNLYDQGIFVITGDHGEEFFEEGSLFHGTHLNEYQLSVPIYLKFPSDSLAFVKEATHIDLFPTILHYLTGRGDFSEFFDGESLLKEKQWPYRIAVLQNGPNIPSEFSLQQGKKQMRAKFISSEIDTALEVIDLQIPENSSEESLEKKIDAYFPEALSPLYKIR